MAKGNLAACLKVTLAYEGGFTKDKRDPGNWTGGKVGKGVLKGTKYGVAAASYPEIDIANLTLDDVAPIYERNYWKPILGDSLPAGVDLATFDYGVNSGPARSIRALQTVVGAKADGKAGAETILKASKADGKATIQALCARRLSFMQSLAIWKTFGKGWSRRVADVEAKAVAMWLAAKGLNTGERNKELANEVVKAAGKAQSQNKAASSTVGGGGALGGADAVVNGDPNWWLIGGVAAAVAIVVVLLVIHARKNKERAAAYAAAIG